MFELRECFSHKYGIVLQIFIAYRRFQFVSNMRMNSAKIRLIFEYAFDLIFRDPLIRPNKIINLHNTSCRHF